MVVVVVDLIVVAPLTSPSLVEGVIVLNGLDEGVGVGKYEGEGISKAEGMGVTTGVGLGRRRETRLPAPWKI